MNRNTIRKKFIHALLFAAALLLVSGTVLPLQTLQADAASTPKKVTMLKLTHKGSTVKVKWKKVSGISGYQIQLASNRAFLGARSVKAKKTAASRSVSFGTGRCYVRIRSYVTSKGKKTYSSWTVSSNTRKTRKAVMKPVKKGARLFELRKAVGEEVPGYDTVQGSCYYGGYAYFIMYNRNVNKCRIAKVKTSSWNVVKFSKVLDLHHGNCMTYNKKTRELVIAHSTGSPKMISIVDPSTLKIKENRTITLPAGLPGMTSHDRAVYNGFGAIAYNSTRNQYVVLLRGAKNHDLVILNASFEPVKYLSLKVKVNQTVQAIDAYGNYVLVGQSFSAGKPWNSILIYDWNGNFQSRVNLNKGTELESIFHDSKRFYASYYSSSVRRKFYSKGKFFRNVIERKNYVYRINGL